MEQSELVVNAEGQVRAYVGPDAVNLMRAIMLKQGLNLYARTKMRMTSGVSPTDMLRAATGYTGKSYKRGDYAKAANDVRKWIDTMRAALPVTKEDKDGHRHSI